MTKNGHSWANSAVTQESPGQRGGVKTPRGWGAEAHQRDSSGNCPLDLWPQDRSVSWQVQCAHSSPGYNHHPTYKVLPRICSIKSCTHHDNSILLHWITSSYDLSLGTLYHTQIYFVVLWLQQYNVRPKQEGLHQFYSPLYFQKCMWIYVHLCRNKFK